MSMMKHIDLISSDSDPLSESEIKIVESATGPLPADFRTYLLESNGGRVLDYCVFSPHRGYGVTQFTVIEHEFPPPDVTIVLGGNSKRIIEVAVDIMDPYMMSLDQADFGSIYYWNYDYEGDARWEAEDAGEQYLPSDSNTTYIADSFSAFLRMLVLQRPEKSAAPDVNSMEHSPINFARYGDYFFSDTKNYFDSYTLSQLNKLYGVKKTSLLGIAARRNQTQTFHYLIERGVDTSDALSRCTHSFEMFKILVNSGTSDQVLKELLTNVALSMTTSTGFEEKQKIIQYIKDQGVKIDFSDPAVFESWRNALELLKIKKVLKFYKTTLELPPEIEKMIDRNLNQSGWDSVFR